jgi:lipoyl(octanoyl) transferase
MPSTGWPSTTSGGAAGGGAAGTGAIAARAHWLGRIGYLEAAALQHELVARRLAGEIPDTVLLLEHPPVITLGRASRQEHLLAPQGVLGARGVEVFETSRGGDVTFHGPGQLVGYVIADLKQHGRDVAQHLRRLEQAVIAFLSGHGLAGGRHPEHTGVWLGRDKVCALGVRVDRWITSHGFALNVTTDLSHFDLIVPCGIRGYGVTSLERAAGRTSATETLGLEAVAADMRGALARTFDWDLRDGGELPAVSMPSPGDRVLGGVRRVFPEPGE